MTVISKAALAAELKVTKSRVSQYVAAGLPVRTDGKLDRETVLNWVSMNCRSGNDHRKGPSRAREIQPPVREGARVLGDCEAARRAEVKMASDVLHALVSDAIDLDLPMRVIYALAYNMQWYLSDRDLIGRDTLSLAYDEVITDWKRLAEEQGELFDPEAWETYRAFMYEKNGG